MFSLLWFTCMITSVSVFVLGLRAVTQEDKLFGFLRERALKTRDTKTPIQIVKEGQQPAIGYHIIKVPLVKEWIHKPLLTCVTCMPSVYGILITLAGTFLFFEPQFCNVWDIVKLVVSIMFICISASFITELFWSLKEYLQYRS